MTHISGPQRSFEEFRMCSRPDKDNFVDGQLIDQQKITANVTLAMIDPISFERMIQPFRSKWANICHKQQHGLFQLNHVEPTCLRQSVPILHKVSRVT